MSATNRVRVVSDALQPPVGCSYPDGTTLRAVTRTVRRKGDFYETPAWAVDSLLPHLPLSDASLVVDAGAGTGAIAACIALRLPTLEVVGIEKQGELVEKARARALYSCEFVQADFETWQSDRSSPDVVIMNPPFSRAAEFIRRALVIVRRGGTVACLLPVSFMFGVGRYDFHTKYKDADIYHLMKRPSFTGDGKTDATNYVWWIFGPGTSGKHLHLRPPTKKKRR